MPIIDTYRPVLARAGFPAARDGARNSGGSAPSRKAFPQDRARRHEIAEFQTGHFRVCSALGKRNER